jgi:hypothetical protein
MISGRKKSIKKTDAANSTRGFGIWDGEKKSKMNIFHWLIGASLLERAS